CEDHPVLPWLLDRAQASRRKPSEKRLCLPSVPDSRDVVAHHIPRRYAPTLLANPRERLIVLALLGADRHPLVDAPGVALEVRDRPDGAADTHVIDRLDIG